MKKIVKIVAIVVAVVLVAAFVAPMLLRGKIAQIVKREANEMLDARVDVEKLDISLLRHFPRPRRSALSGRATRAGNGAAG